MLMAQKMDERSVNLTVDEALGVMGMRVIEEPEEPIENVWESTHGACLAHLGFQHPCPVEWCRFHVSSGGMRDSAMEKLSPESDTCVLRMSSGFPHTLEEVGDAFGVTRERARQIELAALFHLRLGLVRIGAISETEIEASRLSKIKSAYRKWKRSK
jgi:hypothetical protein